MLMTLPSTQCNGSKSAIHQMLRISRCESFLVVSIRIFSHPVQRMEQSKYGMKRSRSSSFTDAAQLLWVSRQYLMRFDLCTSLQDLAWSPYTSTTFAIAAADGKVYMFDIHANKLEPICEQRLTDASDHKCTKLAFNPLHPILLVGDERSVCG